MNARPFSTTEKPDVSIIIVSWNTKDLLAACLGSIDRFTMGISYEIWIVDNGSADGTPAMLRERYPNVHLMVPGTNLGFARANNLALRCARGHYVLFLNPDTELRSNVLLDFTKRMDREQDIGVLGCRLVGPDGKTQLTCAAAYPTPWNALCEGLFLHRLAVGRPALKFLSSRSLEYWDHATEREVDCLSGAFLFCRRAALDKIGGFDEAYFMYGEDLDLCFRVKRDDWRVVYQPSHEVLHVGASSSRQTDSSFARVQQHRAARRLLNLHWGRFRVFRYECAVAVGAFSRLAVFGLASAFPHRLRKEMARHLRLTWSVLTQNLPWSGR